jgi:hypothetical protein
MLATGDRYVRPDTGNQKWASVVGFWVTFTLLTLAGIPVSLFASFVFVMGSDHCLANEAGWLCTVWGQHLVFAVPWVGWGAAILASLVGAGFRRRYDGAHWAGLALGGALYIAAVVGGFLAVAVAVT